MCVLFYVCVCLCRSHVPLPSLGLWSHMLNVSGNKGEQSPVDTVSLGFLSLFAPLTLPSTSWVTKESRVQWKHCLPVFCLPLHRYDTVMYLWVSFFTFELKNCVWNWCRRMLNVWFVLRGSCVAADGTLNSTNYVSACLRLACSTVIMFMKTKWVLMEWEMIMVRRKRLIQFSALIMAGYF